MTARRWMVGGILLACACSRQASLAGTSAGSASEGSDEGTTGQSETGGPSEACTSEWDCGVGERCIDGACACMGCDCSQPTEPPDDDPQPVWLDLVEPECSMDDHCAPLEYCDGHECVPTTACTDDLDCRPDWPTRFCTDGLCRLRRCDYKLDGDLGCPEGSLCYFLNCRWLELLPSCTTEPNFELLVAHTLTTPAADAAVVILDLDADGRDDLAVLENGSLDWIRSTGVGFGPPTPWVTQPGAELVGIGRGDVHGDGVAELLVSHAAPLGVEILVASQAGPQSAGFVTTQSLPSATATLDVDYDGLPDLVVGSAIDGPGTLVEAQLGDGTGLFGPLWLDPVTPFEFVQPYPARDEPDRCRRALASIEPEYFGARRLEHDGVAFGAGFLVHRPVTGHMIFTATTSRADGHVATAALADRGVLFMREFGGQEQFIELDPDPGAVALLSQDHSTNYVLVDHGASPGEFVELSGAPLTPVCRGSLGFALDVSELRVGDFDGDGREDLLGRGADGVLRVWLSRPW